MLYYVGEPREDVTNCTIEECRDYLESIPEIGVDIETQRKYPRGMYKDEGRDSVYKAGLDPYLTKPLMLQLGDLTNQYVIDLRKVDITCLLSVFSDRTKLFVGSNLKFEAKHLGYTYGVVFWKIWDCMLAEIVLTNGQELGYSVEKMAERYLGIKSAKDNDLFNPFEEDEDFVDKSIRMQFIEWGDKPFTTKQIQYGADDITIPFKIMEIQKRGRRGWKPEICWDIENRFCLVLADIELKGLTFDPEQWLKVASGAQVIYEHRLKKMNDYVLKTSLKFCTLPDLFSTETKCNILWSSPAQIVDYFRYLKFCPKEKSKQTKKMEYSVGSKALFKLLSSPYKEKLMGNEETDIVTQEDLILNYLLLQKSHQAITTFGKDFLKYIHPITGRIHTSYLQILATGRISSSRPNIQNIPNDDVSIVKATGLPKTPVDMQYRRAFIPEPGNVILNCDFASQESRDLAEICGDQDMLDFFNLGHPIFGDDYHSFTGTKMFRIIRRDPDLIVTKKTHPKERQDAKAIGFKIAYGGSAYTLKDDFGVEEDIAQSFIDGYFEAFPSLKEDFEKAKKSVLELGYINIDKITGRRWFWKDFKKQKELSDKIWSFYPKNYREMSIADRAAFKAKLKVEHPEVSEMWSEYFSAQGKAERNALNYRVQGLAGSQTKMAGIYFREHQILNNLQDKVWLTNLIHDEALGEAKQEFAEEGRAILQDCMERGAQYFCKLVTMKAECVTNSFWYH